MIRALVAVLALVAALAAPPAHAGNVTCTLQRRILLGPQGAMLVATNVAMSSSYATNGDTFSTNNTLADVSNCLCGDPHYKPISVDLTAVQGSASPSSAVDLFRYDTTANKIQAYTALSTEVSNGVNLSAFVLALQTLCI